MNLESAATLRELAAHHEKLASGTLSTPPKNATTFEQGAGAPEPSAAELRALAAKASTPAEHHELEEYFLSAAKRYDQDVKDHAAMAEAYVGTRAAQLADHCNRLAKLARDEAKEARDLAQLHKQLANVAKQ